MDKYIYIYSDVAIYIYIYMVGGIPTPLKNMNVSWDDYSQYMEKKNVPNHKPDIYTVYRYRHSDIYMHCMFICL